MAGRLRRVMLDGLPEPTLRRIQRIRHRENLNLDRPVARSAPGGAGPEVVTEFDAHAVRAEVVARVRAALDDASIGYVLVPGPRGTVRQVAVDADDRAAALA